MNIFVLDQDIALCASYHNDKHVVKMIVESIQLLSTSLRHHGVDDPVLYKATHKNHPCAVWTRTNRSNFMWLSELTFELFNQFVERYGKSHASMYVFDSCLQYADVVPAGELTEHPKCMPEQYQVESVVESYRNYYRLGKQEIAQWKNGIPEWYQ